MLVILQRNINNIGVKGSVVKVKGGYARNYLIPQKDVLPATKENLLKLQKIKSELEKQNAKALEAAKKLAESVQKLSITISRKANTLDGKLFGAVMPRDIVQELAKSNIDVTTKDIAMPNIKQIGEYIVEVVLHPNVVLKLPLFIKNIEDDTTLQ